MVTGVRWLGLQGRHTPPWLPRWRTHPPSNLCMPLRAEEDPGVHCFGCNLDQRRGRCYVVCFECGHGYWTKLHLLAAHWRRDWQARRWAPPGTPRSRWPLHWVRPSDIAICPCCTHDL